MAEKSNRAVKTQPKAMMNILDNLRKEFGNDAIFSGDDEVLENAEAISTNSYALDNAIGILGVPRGRITQLAGAEASGKTLMALQIVKKWQSKHKDNWALWIDAEYSFNAEWATLLGVDLSRLMIHQDNLGSEIFNFLCGIPNAKKSNTKDKLGFLDNLIELGKNNTCGVVVLDSVAAIEPPVEAAYEVGHQNMAAMARFMPAALRRLVPLVHDANVAFVAINQVRVDPGVMYGNPETTPGGKAWKHFCRLMINFAKLNAKEKLILDANEQPIGHTVKAKIQKNSFSIPRDTEFVLKYLEGVAYHNVEMLDLAIKYDIVQRPNNRTYVYNDNKWNGREVAEAAFLDNGLFNEMWEKVKMARVNSLNIESKSATPKLLGIDDELEE
jgi:recombination protein RecA